MNTKTRLFLAFEQTRLEALQYDLATLNSIGAKLRVAISIKTTKEKINLLQNGNLPEYLCYN
jgi:hypothetical protein